MKNLIRKILREGEGFKDSSAEDWEWTEDWEPKRYPHVGDRYKFGQDIIEVLDVMENDYVEVIYIDPNGVGRARQKKNYDKVVEFINDSGSWGRYITESEGFKDSSAEDWEWTNDVGTFYLTPENLKDIIDEHPWFRATITGDGDVDVNDSPNFRNERDNLGVRGAGYFTLEFDGEKLTEYSIGLIEDDEYDGIISYQPSPEAAEWTIDRYEKLKELLSPYYQDQLPISNEIDESIIKEIGNKRRGDTDIVYRDKNIVIVLPKSFESSKSFSRNTQYCTGGDCGGKDDESMESMFKNHSDSGDKMYRIFFKDGTKIRLTKENDIHNTFHWGLGRKDDYITFTDDNMEHPFSFDELKKKREELLSLGGKVKQFKRIMSKTEEEIFHNNNDYKNNNKREEYNNIYHRLLDKLDLVRYQLSTKSWWEDGHDLLLKYMEMLPQEALNKMNEESN